MTDAVVANSAAAAAYAIAHERLDPAKVRIIRNGVELDRPDVGGRSGDQSDSSSARRLTSSLVGCVANYLPVKRHDLLIDAFSARRGCRARERAWSSSARDRCGGDGSADQDARPGAASPPLTGPSPTPPRCSVRSMSSSRRRAAKGSRTPCSRPPRPAGPSSPRPPAGQARSSSMGRPGCSSRSTMATRWRPPCCASSRYAGLRDVARSRGARASRDDVRDGSVRGGIRRALSGAGQGAGLPRLIRRPPPRTVELIAGAQGRCIALVSRARIGLSLADRLGEDLVRSLDPAEGGFSFGLTHSQRRGMGSHDSDSTHTDPKSGSVRVTTLGSASNPALPRVPSP